jgi:transcription elongation GreA/GreB family factor
LYRNGTIQLGDVVEFIVTTPKDERARQRKLSVRISESAASGAINPQSPVGQALLGSKKGDTVTVKAPGGHYRVKITSVHPDH